MTPEDRYLLREFSSDLGVYVSFIADSGSARSDLRRFLSQRNIRAQNDCATKWFLCCKRCQYGDCTTLTESANNDSIRGYSVLFFFLRNEVVNPVGCLLKAYFVLPSIRVVKRVTIKPVRWTSVFGMLQLGR